jgi:Tol biopolymer transport system component
VVIIMKTKTRIRLFIAVLSLLVTILLMTKAVMATDINTTTRVSVDSSGMEGNGDSGLSSVSADGHYVAFESSASNLVSEDTNEVSDIFLHDTLTGATTLVSVDSSGVQGNGDSESPSISADGRYVAFQSSASNLVSGDTNEASDIFMQGTQTGATARISLDSSGVQGNGDSESPSISADGRYVAFMSYANNLVSGDTNSTGDIFLRNTQTGTTTRLSVDSNEAQANGQSYEPSISADGRYVAFTSMSSNLVSGYTDYSAQIYLRDSEIGTTTAISRELSGISVGNWSEFPSISSDGRYVAFSSLVCYWISGDTIYTWVVFLRDTKTGTITLLPFDSSVKQINGQSYAPSISANGRYVGFTSIANNLVNGDTNGKFDVFVAPAPKPFTNHIYLPLAIR